MNFSELNLEPALQQNLQKMNFETCTPIQEKSIPVALRGEDLFGLAQTGTGKTAAFLVPLINQYLKEKGEHLYLIMEPTRELVDQVLENLEKLVAECGIETVGIYGGTGYDKQKAGLKKKPQFIVATPGRLIDLFKEGLIDFHKVKALVFDEADRMFDLGFKPDMKYILARVPRERQILMFSATLNFDVLQTAYQFGSSPVEIDLSRDQARAENVTDAILHVGHEDKPKYLLSLLKKQSPKQAIVFTNFKSNVDRLANFLNDNGVIGIGISSLLNQTQRNRVIEQFKTSELPSVMVATDLAARGLDIQGVDLVINYELPSDSESYVHRIGRTGRAGNLGHAFSLVSDRDVDSLQRIETYLKGKLEVGWMEENEILNDLKPMKEERFERSFPRRDSRPGGPPRDSRGPRNAGGKKDFSSRPPRREGAEGGGAGGGGRRNNNENRPRTQNAGATSNGGRTPHAGNKTKNVHASARASGGANHSANGAAVNATGGGGHKQQGHQKPRHANGARHDQKAVAPAGKAISQPHRGKHDKRSGRSNTTPPSAPNPGIGGKIKKLWKNLFSK